MTSVLSGPSVQHGSKLNVRDHDGLYGLIGPSAPSMVAQLRKPRQKEDGVTKWEWKKFSNSARKDSLRLCHWAKSNENSNAYQFSKYNKHPPEYSYNDEEYGRLLEDPEWTRDETDYLFSVVKNYDQRWHVIYDRYYYNSGRERTVEDLKDRFCHACRRLVKDRITDPEARKKALEPYQFDKDRELTRKRYLSNLDGRAPREIEEEEALFLEIKRLEQNERKFKRDREELLRTLAGIESGLPDIVEDELPLSLFDSSKNNKRKRGTADAESPISTPIPPSATLSALGTTKRTAPVNPKIPPEDPIQCIRHIELSPTTPATKAAHQPSFLRTFKLPNPKTSTHVRLVSTLQEVGLTYNRLVMPTEGNVALLHTAVDAATALIEHRKALEKVEADIAALKEKHGVEGDVASEMGMEEYGHGRSLSVATSARSARNKRGRSLSASSADTVPQQKRKR
ncbi:hypothetical protein CYLTODRAFT_385709 [Cylindrobasidium torrendii FP15055 ss-10]|uniref:SWR1-complex protein 4 n=1 Tax=Cylindrobasidium torrendii FP15055 ss-10 TaxID=1314674 RepID=A0A0D7BUV9_9AGAR|nr:hypothetical protein CYLTODRAFT_385709 [Cylindrobasidium torrendii FP15055 ss-10]